MFFPGYRRKVEAYQELFRRRLVSYLEKQNLIVGKMSETELKEAVDEVCEQIRKDTNMDPQTHEVRKAMVYKVMFGAQKKYWVKE